MGLWAGWGAEEASAATGGQPASPPCLVLNSHMYFSKALGK